MARGVQRTAHPDGCAHLHSTSLTPTHAALSGPCARVQVLWHVRSAGHVLSRSSETEAVYTAHRRQVRASGQRLTDQVLSYFSDGTAAFTPALFPYALSPEIRHWILWLRRPSYDAWRRHIGPAAELRLQVRRVYGRAAGAVAFVQNLEGERSIAAVPHYHVFVVNSSELSRSLVGGVAASRCVVGNDSGTAMRG